MIRPQFVAFLLIFMINTVSLRNNRDFKNVYDNGISRAEHFFVMYIIGNNTDHNRLGISVSKKVGNSVIRHRVKRLVKECYRLNESNYKKGLDIIVIARNTANGISFDRTQRSLSYLGKKLGIIFE